jgi:methionine biosynthesis protein MetW
MNTVAPEGSKLELEPVFGGSADPLRYDVTTGSSEVCEIILSMIPKGSRVLDVGCGTGTIALKARDSRGAEVIGIEPNAQRASLANARGIRVLTGTFSAETVSALGNFDAVLFADVLEHVANPAPMLSLSRMILSSTGCVIASIPNVAHWSMRVSLLFGHFDYEAFGLMDATHLRWYTLGAARQLFLSEGYRIDNYAVSTDARPPVFCYKRPWCYAQAMLRGRPARLAARLWPELFGCQHVIKASPR